MSELRIWQDCEYVRVTQGAEYASISLSMPYYYLKMREYASVTLNMIEYSGINLKK